MRLRKTLTSSTIFEVSLYIPLWHLECSSQTFFIFLACELLTHVLPVVCMEGLVILTLETEHIMSKPQMCSNVYLITRHSRKKSRATLRNTYNIVRKIKLVLFAEYLHYLNIWGTIKHQICKRTILQSFLYFARSLSWHMQFLIVTVTLFMEILKFSLLSENDFLINQNTKRIENILALVLSIFYIWSPSLYSTSICTWADHNYQYVDIVSQFCIRHSLFVRHASGAT